jgi:uncharacterized LabA/DUF88 family protein
MVRVITYIDGFNLYFGLKESKLKKYYWLNVRTLASKLLMFNQELMFTKYFTARISGEPQKEKRQSTYIEALETLRGYNDFEIYYGHYRKYPYQCPHCSYIYNIPHEKMTDVSIATEMLLDAINDRFDRAILISADSDLVPPIKAIRSKFNDKKIIVAFPPKRHSVDLIKAANGYIYINNSILGQSLLSPSIKKDNGFTLTCPAEWK